jgi:hemoglobin-like flavoprotein
VTPSQIDYIRESFALVRPISDQAGTIFYDKLFELDPTLRGMFKTDIKEQSKKLMHMLATVVSSLDKPDVLVPAVKRLGERHVDYQVRDSHYDTVGEALLWTLGTASGKHSPKTSRPRGLPLTRFSQTP